MVIITTESTLIKFIIMENLYFKPAKHNLRYLVFSILFIIVSIQTKAQVRKGFTQRTAVATPLKTIYNIKGDFTLLGNTNLTLKTYSNTVDNDQEMIYVDIDGDSNTWNSSSANLELSTENGATPSCSNILFAGLYWTGKSDDADTFTASKQIQTGIETINNSLNIGDSTPITNTNYSLAISRGGIVGSRYPIYTFTGNVDTYVFNYTNNSGSNSVTLSINGATATNIPVTVVTSGTTTATATLITPITIVDGTVTLTISQLIRDTQVNLTTANTRSTSSASVNVSGTIPTYTTLTKNYDKKVVSLKGPLAASYTTITANAADIWYPGASDDGIYVGYKEITDYVKTNGLGAYTVADIALKEGIGPAPGFSGGWGMIVVYENPKMNSRAVTVFDGYANENGSFVGDIPISGFIAVLSGQVNMKLGVMASEGDIMKTGDYLKVQQLNTLFYTTLSHSGNSLTNFYNSSILTGGNIRNPNLVNNTGIDLSMFTIPNALNLNIANGQTSTNFKYGSTLDKFSIFGFAMSVDSYVPEPKGLISVNSINNITNPPVLNALPGQTINYSLNITNEGTEATNSTIVSIPIPATSIFHTGTIVYNTYHGFAPGTTPTYNSGTNTITWNLGTLPITSNHPEYIYADLSFTLDVTNDCSIILNAGCNPEVSLETGTITGIGATSGSSFTKYFFQGYDATSCHLPIDGSIKVAINGGSCTTAMAGPDQVSACGGENVTLAATAGTAGIWSIVNGPSGGGEVFSNSTSPTSGFYSLNPGTYTLRWTSTSCGAHNDDVLATISLCDVVNFDGVDDNINFKDNFNLNSSNFSIEAWVKSNATNGNTQTILSKHLSPSSTDGYDLRLINNLISFNWNNNSIIATHAIDTNRWYHIAITFDGTNYKLYIDGILDKTTTGVNPTSNSVDCILGAMSQNTDTPYNYYNGYTDELRIWKVSLTVDQIRQMMNQEITDDGNGNVKGVIVPKNISGLSWTNLAGYYQMNRASDINNGYLIDKSGNSKNGKLKGIYVQEPDTAPIPYTSGANGSWEIDTTWTNFPVWDVPNSVGIDGTTKIDWNIVKTSHSIISNGNKIVLGLLVDSNTLSAANDSKIEISSYLKLDGKIDLVGMSQLVQTSESDLDVTSSGSIERDQQGQSNLYNYNYWCSPTSPINITANNTNYSIAGIMKDGTTTTPQNITWIGGYNGAPGPPISLARYWLYKFDNYANAYASWSQILETSSIRVGQGYTMKGSGASSGVQNYTFVGKPNNGLITSNTVAADNLLLTGNPYPSALDSKAFINDNLDSIDGSLYFWEHYTSNNTHILRDYQGGYAVLNLIGGVAPTSTGVDYISGLGTTSRGAPNQNIPVGQGFFVNGKPTAGGIITFKNSQRGFHKETQTETGGSNILFKTKANTKTHENTNVNDNDPIVKDTYMKIRLGFNSNNGYHRQVLLGFMNEKATSEMDYGYDAINLDNFPNDMYLLNGKNKLVIEGEGFFDTNACYAIGVKTAVEGKVSFIIDALENFNPEQAIFIYDNVTDTYNDIRNRLYEVNLPIGVNDSRFSLRFTDKTLGVNKLTNTISDIQISHIQNGNTLVINNKQLDETVQKVTLFNVLGQSIATWKIENQDQQNIQIPIKNVSSGIYIAKVKTSNGDFSKKIIIP